MNLLDKAKILIKSSHHLSIIARLTVLPFLILTLQEDNYFSFCTEIKIFHWPVQGLGLSGQQAPLSLADSGARASVTGNSMSASYYSKVFLDAPGFGIGGRSFDE